MEARLIAVLAVVALLAVGAGAALLATSTDSLPYLRPVLWVATSTEAYVFFLGVLVWRIIRRRDQQYAATAADVCGYEPRSVRRLAYEAREPDDTTRVIVTSEDEPEEITERVLAALKPGAEDDTMSLNEEAFTWGDEEETDPKEALLVDGDLAAVNEAHDDALFGVVHALQERSHELKNELDADLQDLLTASPDEEAVADAIRSDRDRCSITEIFGDGEESTAELEEKRDELEANVSLQEDILEKLRSFDGPLREPAPEPEPEPQGDDEDADVALWKRAVSGVRGFVSLLRRPRALVAAVFSVFVSVLKLPLSAIGEFLSRPNAYEVDDDEDDVGDPWREQYKMFRLDLASTVDFQRLIWQFAVPAALTVVALLIAVRFWVQAWLYPPLLAAGVLVGLANYARLSYKRSRRLETLRSERDTVNWNDLSILVKEVDVPEARVQYAWMADKRYAHDNREEFAEDVAFRAYELVNGVEVSPSIMEKQATQLETNKPDLHGFRDTEKEQIMTWLVERVEDAQHGLVPKAKLIEECVEYDIEKRRFAPGKRGKGYDPELVREAYRDLVPAALVEQEIALEEDGAETVTAVRHRADPLPPEYGQVRAQFTSQFGNYARWDPVYELPDVSDRLDEDPVFANTLGYRGEA